MTYLFRELYGVVKNKIHEWIKPSENTFNTSASIDPRNRKLSDKKLNFKDLFDVDVGSFIRANYPFG